LRGFDPLSDHLSFWFAPPEISVDRVGVPQVVTQEKINVGEFTQSP
jgi:hypothetical protein